MANERKMAGWGSVLVVAILVLLLPPTTQKAWGQALTGSIVGNVTDSSGAAVPDAAVTITETGTQQVRSGPTQRAGSYDFEAVQPGAVRCQNQQDRFHYKHQNPSRSRGRHGRPGGRHPCRR